MVGSLALGKDTRSRSNRGPSSLARRLCPRSQTAHLASPSSATRAAHQEPLYASHPLCPLGRQSLARRWSASSTREELYGGRHTDFDGMSDSDTDSASDADSYTDGSDYDSEMEASTTRMDMSIVREPPSSQSDQHTSSRRPAASSSLALPEFFETEQQKPEDPADLWGGDYNFANGNERAGAGNSILGSRGGMFGFDSALRTGLLDEPETGLDDGTEFASLQRDKQRRRNEEDRLLSEMTLGSILQSLRTVMMLTPRLKDLALDGGVLERSIAGRRAMCNMGKLKSLSLGPPPPYWSSPLLFGHPFKTTRRRS